MFTAELERLLQRPVIVALGVGTLLGVGFYWAGLWWLFLPGVVWLIAIIAHTTLRQAVLITWLAWWWKALLVLSFFWYTYPIEWLSAAPATQLFLIFWYWSTTALWVSIGGVIFAVGAWYWFRYVPRFWDWVGLPGLWVVAELSGAVSFSIILAGPGSTFGVAFGYGFLGYLLAYHQLLFHLSQWGGVVALTVTAILIGLGSYRLLIYVSPHYRIPASLVILVGFALSGSLSTVHPSPTSGEGTKVAVVATEFPSNMAITIDGEAQKSHAILAALAMAPADSFEYVLLPEYARVYEAQGVSPIQLLRIRDQIGSTATIIQSGPYRDLTGLSLRGSIVRLADLQTFNADKQQLVPQGEYMPHFHRWFLNVFGQRENVSAVIDRLEYRAGPLATQIFPEGVPSILFCFESAHPFSVWRLLQQHQGTPPFIAHPISHVWFHAPTAMWQQKHTMLRVHARWQGVPIVAGGNFAPSAVYLPDGTKQTTATAERLVTQPNITVYVFSLP